MTPLNLAEEFAPITVEEWEAQIRTDLKGADYEKRLVWKSEEGVAVRPYYTRRDAETLGKWLHALPGQFPYSRGSGRPWQIVEAEQQAPVAQVAADEWHNQGATTVQELAFSMAAGVEQLTAAVAAGELVETAAPKLVFRYAIGSNFFFEIAKLRAARLLWSQVVTSFGVSEPEACYLRIHAVTSTANKTLYDANNNLLRAAAEGLAAVLGSCDWLTVKPFQFDSRLALNVQRILAEECHLDRVADAGGGSYYLEKLTWMLSTEAWKLFQNVEGQGGMETFRESGALKKALDDARAQRERAVATRKRVMVGTNVYADPNEVLPEESIEEVEGWRMAGIFERLRRRTEQHVRKTGAPVRVLLLESGDVKMRKARSGFCSAYFTAAGFQTVTAGEVRGDAAIVVLCSSDPEYPELAKQVCSSSKAPVLVAGYPKEMEAALREAGVAGFVYLGSNAVEVLEHCQKLLGMGEQQ
jgi:methylmalonyl-CoA mutase